MLQYSNITDLSADSGAFSFGFRTSSKYKSALYRQVLTIAGLRSGQVLLELSCAADGNPKVMATVHVVETDPMGGLPGLHEIATIETGSGKENPGLSLPWSAESFDTIIVVGIFNHLSDQAGTIAEAHRLLSPGGKLVIADQWFRKAGPLLANLLLPYMRGKDFRIYSPDSVTGLLKKSGFGFVETRPAGATNFLCSAKAIK